MSRIRSNVQHDSETGKTLFFQICFLDRYNTCLEVCDNDTRLKFIYCNQFAVCLFNVRYSTLILSQKNEIYSR